MIPFARIMTYGNVAPVKEEVASYGADSSYFAVLSNKGNLYISGFNGRDYFGNTDTTLTLTGTGISKAWYGNTNTSSVIILKDGKYYQRGAFMKGGVVKTWYDLSTDINKLPQGVQIVDFQVTPSLFVLLSNGDLYGLGLNQAYQFGTGNTSTPANWVLLGSNVKKFIAGAVTTVYLTNSGDIYASGTNYSGSLLGSNRTTFTKIGTGVYDELFCVGRSNIKNLIMHNTVDGFWYGTGTNSTGRGGSLANPNIVSRFTSIPANFYRNGSGSDFGNTSTMIVDSKLYTCGWNQWGMTGLGINDGNDTLPFTLVSSASNPISSVTTDQTSYYMNSSKEIFGCGYGRDNNLPGANGQRTTFTKLTLPF